MSHYRSNPRDVAFWLFEVLDREKLLGHPPFEELDRETVMSILDEVDRLARGPLSESFESADRTAPAIDPETGRVTTEPGFRSSVQAWVDAEFWRLRLPRALGGSGAPPSLVWAVDEFLLGANPAIWVYTSIPSAARVIHQHGTQRDRALAQHMVDRGWPATMVITEPDAGSDVGHARTWAAPNGDGTWNLTGTKRFITAGDHDLSENIVHMVLARPVDAAAQGRHGTKGLSLFLVPKYHVNPETWDLTGERNGVVVSAVERKMGMTASATCELVLGEDRPAVGWLLGEVHDGIAQMFSIIEDARMMVGTKAMATMSTGYLRALDYARSRVQGTAIRDMFDRTAARVAIVEHPDVRRSLLVQKSTAEGLRGLVMFTASVQDDIIVGHERGTDVQALTALNDLLLPVVKGYGSERAWVVLGTESLQTLGGSGFLRDYPLEQYVRDAKIDSLYEGTTAIQGLDLFFRKIARDDGATLRALLDNVRRFAPDGSVQCEDDLAELQAATARLGTAANTVAAIAEHLLDAWRAASRHGVRPLGPEVHAVGLDATRLLFAIGDLLLGWLLLRGADRAATALASAKPGEVAFYRGKIEVASFFARAALPRLAGELAAVEASDPGRLMALEIGSL